MTVATLLARATRRTVLAHVRHVRPVAPHRADGLVARVYGQVERDFGMLAPPMALHSPAPDVLAASWTMLRETLVATGPAGRAAKEAVAAAVSAANRCPYCVDVHGATLVGLFPGGDGAGPAVDRLDDGPWSPLARWAGRPSPHGPAGPPPAPAAQVPELVGVAVVFHYLNRMVNVFLRDSPLPDTPSLARGVVQRTAARVMGALARRPCPPGAALELLAAAPPPADLAWAGATVLADGLARGYAAIEDGGRQVVPAGVRELVAARCADPQDGPAGISARPWVEDAVAGLSPVERPAGRLALLTAFASYQVTDAVVADFRAHHPGDDALVTLTAWAALTAARRYGPALAGGPDVTEPTG
ncbi:alkylhydroperoxidase AhpD family core domain-containing protein [Micromonospora matsumotoense]|uniref:Alkylhydroperoxidase AhpD family core domain-containing protein n=1 Tax=Micromonospora matsumotoense TaxID=121616 RepID=A0A1C4X1A4_9ACTN|nr:carboxymuconolactone decarboxylase family protein [Micromonospora matsumotoense]SCF02245.1 alkylhydroperoxidase AhpD family core domain-containing protein [Micromonospora matsumotoense]